MRSFHVATGQRNQMIEITDEVRRCIVESGVEDGIVTVFAAHTTAAITINENADPDVVRDLNVHLSRLSPEKGDYRHTEGNSDSHLKSTLVGASETVLLNRGRLILGTWQGIYFCEFDGPRQRTVHVKVIGQ